MKPVDVAIVGGGPAGLATAIEVARRGLRAVVLERRQGPLDKACGEGLMPPGLRALEAFGALEHLGPADSSRIEGIRYWQEDGVSAEGRLPGDGGLGVRRLALIHALRRAAVQHGAQLEEGRALLGFRVHDDGVALSTTEGVLHARFLVGADGLASRVRALAHLEGPEVPLKRYGLRQHFRRAPWTRWVEVHLTDGVEAYVTPVGDARVGVAFLWEKDRLAQPDIGALLLRFPRLAAELQGAPSDSTPRGAGPLFRRAKRVVAPRVALVGDAAGYVDAITGEGLSLAFTCARALGEALPQALEAGAGAAALASYERAFARTFRKYAWLTRAMLALARRPALRRPVIRALSHSPRAFSRILGWAVG